MRLLRAHARTACALVIVLVFGAVASTRPRGPGAPLVAPQAPTPAEGTQLRAPSGSKLTVQLAAAAATGGDARSVRIDSRGLPVGAALDSRPEIRPPPPSPGRQLRARRVFTGSPSPSGPCSTVAAEPRDVVIAVASTARPPPILKPKPKPKPKIPGLHQAERREPHVPLAKPVTGRSPGAGRRAPPVSSTSCRS